jgi:hypothetical protein
MKIPRAIAAAALTVCFAAQAATFVLPTPNPVTVTYDSSLMSLQTTLQCTEGPVDCFGFFVTPVQTALASGTHVYSLTFSSEVPFTTWFNAWFSAEVAKQPSDVQLRFSYSTLSQSVRLVDVDTGSVLAFSPSSQLSEANAGTATHVRLDMIVDFAGGHFLTPSSDPTCASISCMNMGTDLAVLPYLTVAAVPEPAQAAMLTAGFGLLGLVARRRRKA